MLLDKTGTLTQGTFSVTGIESFGDYTADELLAYLAGLEQSANHPIADGILAQAKRKMFSRRKRLESKRILVSGSKG